MSRWSSWSSGKSRKEVAGYRSGMLQVQQEAIGIIRCSEKQKKGNNLPTHPGCFCIITAKAVICSKMTKSIIDVWFATKTCNVQDACTGYKLVQPLQGRRPAKANSALTTSDHSIQTPPNDLLPKLNLPRFCTALIWLVHTVSSLDRPHLSLQFKTKETPRKSTETSCQPGELQLPSALALQRNTATRIMSSRFWRLENRPSTAWQHWSLWVLTNFIGFLKRMSCNDYPCNGTPIIKLLTYGSLCYALQSRQKTITVGS